MPTQIILFQMQTIFEIGNTSKNDQVKSVMMDKRKKHADVVERFRHKIADESQKIDDKPKTLEASSQVGIWGSGVVFQIIKES
jgi:hypothetical protein